MEIRHILEIADEIIVTEGKILIRKEGVTLLEQTGDNLVDRLYQTYTMMVLTAVNTEWYEAETAPGYSMWVKHEISEGKN